MHSRVVKYQTKIATVACWWAQKQMLFLVSLFAPVLLFKCAIEINYNGMVNVAEVMTMYNFLTKLYNLFDQIVCLI